MNSALICLVVVCGCSGTWGAEHRTTVRVANVATAATAGLAMAADWCQTRHAASSGRMYEWEGGFPTQPMIGGSPTPHAVDAYFALSTAALAGLAQLVPERYRWVGYGVVLGVEAVTVVGNLQTTRCLSVGR